MSIKEKIFFCAVFAIIIISVECKNLNVFTNVEFKGYAMYEEVFKKTIKKGDKLSEYLPESKFDKISINNQHVPILKEGSLSNLDYLDELLIESSNVRIIEPDTFKNNPGMRVLSLKGNKIKEIKNGVFNNLAISSLDLNNNEIEIIDEKAFDHIPEIITIKLEKNKIKDINPNWFYDTPFLSTLYLSDNEIREIPSEAFKNLKGERAFSSTKLSLFLSNNIISTIHKDAFKGIQHIRYLLLSNNKIGSVDDKIFKDTNIEVLNFFNNKIECLNENQLSVIFNTNKTDISGNPFDCGCLPKIKQWTVKHNKNVDLKFDELQCDIKKLDKQLTSITRY